MSVAQIKHALINKYFQLQPSEAAKVLNDDPVDEVIEQLKSHPVEISSQIFVRLNNDVAAQVLKGMDEILSREILSSIEPAHGALILSRLNDDILQSKLALLAPALAKEYKEMLSYPDDTAGSLMDTRVIEVTKDESIESVLEKIRAKGQQRITDVCVVDQNKVLVGSVPVQEIAIAELDQKISELITKKPIAILAISSKEDVVQLLEEKKLSSLPVVDHQNKLLGIIRYEQLINAAQQSVSEDIQAMFGVSRDEKALSKVSFSIKKRLPWLEINLVTAFLAATVVGLFEDTIAKYTALAVFLPVVAGQSGNTGSQALAVTMRGLALREIRPRHWFKMASKEIFICLVNGVAVALTTSLAVYVWMRSEGLSFVIGVAMVISMVIAGFSGAIIPMILQKLGQDPAASSSIVLTTVTDVVGFFTFLGLATLMASFL